MHVSQHGDKVGKNSVEGRTNVHNLQRSGRPSDSMSFDNVQQLHDLLEEDRHMMMLKNSYSENIGV